MNKKIYQISVEFEMYVSAENPREAERIARKSCSEELNNLKHNQIFVISEEIGDINRVPKEDRASLPWSNDPSCNLTIEDLLS